MDLLKKSTKYQTFRLIYSELLVLIVFAAVCFLLLHSSLGSYDRWLSLHLPVGLAAGAFACFKHKILLKINYPAYLVILAALYGVLMFCLHNLLGTPIFTCFLAGGFLLFCLSAYAGRHYKGKVNSNMIYLLCHLLVLCAIIVDFLLISLTDFNKCCVLSVALGICGALLNFIDFSRINQLYRSCLKSEKAENTDLRMTELLFVNLGCCLCAPEAIRLGIKLMLYIDFKMNNTKNNNL